jgi:hypothetical protein
MNLKSKDIVGLQELQKYLIFYASKILYDYFPYSLEGEIENRKKSIDN